MLDMLTPEQIEKAKAIKKPKGRYYTEESYQKALNQDLERELMKMKTRLVDELLGYFLAACVLNVADMFDADSEQVTEFLNRTSINFKAFDSGELSFEEQRDVIHEELGIRLELDRESLL